MLRRPVLLGFICGLLIAPAVAQGPNVTIPNRLPDQGPSPLPVELGSGELYVYIANLYNATLSILGIPGATKRGLDEAVGILRWNGETYQGTLRAEAVGLVNIETAIGGCSDGSNGTQEIFAVAHPQPSVSGLSPSDTLIYGQRGLEDLVFYFFPEGAPNFTAGPGDCQGMLRFEGYGSGYNDAPYPWLPQVRDPGDFLPFNDTRWTTQNGLLAYAPARGERMAYRFYLNESGVHSLWFIVLSRAY